MKRIVLWMVCGAGLALAQPPDFGPPPFGPGGFGGRGPGGPGGPGMGQKTKLLEQFDKDGDGYLNAAERKAAREYLATRPAGGRGRRGGFGGRGGPGGPGGMFGDMGSSEPAKPGAKVSPKDVKTYGKEPLYDMSTLRTLFFQFDDADWEKELSDFYKTDVDIPATLTVDGKVYKDVGVHIRGNTSSMMVPEGRKRSLGVSIGFLNDEQRLLGYRSLNLMNSNADPTFMRISLYHYIARQYIASPQSNWVRVVLNGEDWGIYVNTQQINGDLAKDFFKTTKGARWKVGGSPNGRGGLSYLGEDPEQYKRVYEIKSKDTKESWAALIHLCKVLNQTPPDQLEKALAPILDVEGALKFLAIDKATINNDGFWTRASDYSIYQDPDGKFHLIPWDANETFREPEMMGRGGGGGGSEDATLDIFAGANDPNKALLGKLLAVPSLKAKYVAYIKDIAQNWFDWKKMGPKIAEWQSLIAENVKADTRKIFSTEAFTKSVTVDGFEPGRGPTAPPYLSLKSFLEQRRAYLLKN
jgi:hypothetical protein